MVLLFPKCKQVMTWFLACKSITMIYRSSLSFFTLHGFLAKLRALDLVQFSDQTVFRTFILNACRYWPVFWHGSQSSSFTDHFRVWLSPIDFWQNYHVLQIEFEFCDAPSNFGEIMDFGLSKFQQSNSFLHFLPKRLQILSWFLACKSIIMTYTSSWSFFAPHWFFAELEP